MNWLFHQIGMSGPFIPFIIQKEILDLTNSGILLHNRLAVSLLGFGLSPLLLSEYLLSKSLISSNFLHPFWEFNFCKYFVKLFDNELSCIHAMQLRVEALALCHLMLTYNFLPLTSDPAQRPTFQELVERLRELQRRYAIQLQAARSASGDSNQKESQTHNV